MTILVATVDVIIVVLPVTSARIVRRVDINAIDFARVAEEQALERVVVLAVDDDLIGLVTASLNASGLAKASIDGLVVLGDRHEVLERDLASLAWSVDADEPCNFARHGLDPPADPVLVRFPLTTRRHDLHGVSYGDELAVEAHALGAVVLKDEAELALLRERTDVGGELGVSEPNRLVHESLYLSLRRLSHRSPALPLLTHPLAIQRGAGPSRFRWDMPRANQYERAASIERLHCLTSVRINPKLGDGMAGVGLRRTTFGGSLGYADRSATSYGHLHAIGPLTVAPHSCPHAMRRHVMAQSGVLDVRDSWRSASVCPRLPEPITSTTRQGLIYMPAPSEPCHQSGGSGADILPRDDPPDSSACAPAIPSPDGRVVGAPDLLVWDSDRLGNPEQRGSILQTGVASPGATIGDAPAVGSRADSFVVAEPADHVLPLGSPGLVTRVMDALDVAV